MTETILAGITKRQPRRGKLEIIHAILRACRKPIQLTHLLAKTNLTNSRAKHYLTHLKQKGLIEEYRAGYLHIFTLTDKGKLALELFNKIERLLDA